MIRGQPGADAHAGLHRQPIFEILRLTAKIQPQAVRLIVPPTGASEWFEGEFLDLANEESEGVFERRVLAEDDLGQAWRGARRVEDSQLDVRSVGETFAFEMGLILRRERQ